VTVAVVLPPPPADNGPMNDSAPEPWPSLLRIAFRFGFVLFGLSALKMLALDLEYDAAHGTMELIDANSEEAEPKPQALRLTTIDATQLELDGTLDGDETHARLRQRDLSKVTLHRRFHWVDDGGYGR
jgi:hypothetical protein